MTFRLVYKAITVFVSFTNSRRSAIELGAPRCHKGSSLARWSLALGARVFSDPALYVMLFMPCLRSLLEKHRHAPFSNTPSSVNTSARAFYYPGAWHWPSLCIQHCSVHLLYLLLDFLPVFPWDAATQPWSRHKTDCFAESKELECAGGSRSDFRHGSALYGSFCVFRGHVTPDEMVLTDTDPVRALPCVPGGMVSNEASEWSRYIAYDGLLSFVRSLWSSLALDVCPCFVSPWFLANVDTETYLLLTYPGRHWTF